MIDTHCHLNDRRFRDTEEEVKSAEGNGVEKMVVCGWDIDSSLRAVELSNEFDSVYACVGIHPHDAQQGKKTENINRLREMAKGDKVVGIGEIGLDFYRNFSPSSSQLYTFEAQVELAAELNMPMSIHIRDAFDSVFEILDRVKYYKGVLHCFSGGIDEATWAAERGMFVSFSGSITFGSKKLKKALLSLPEELIVIETDSPYIVPSNLRKKVEHNRPAFLKFINSEVSRIRGWSFEEGDRITSENAKRLFNV